MVKKKKNKRQLSIELLWKYGAKVPSTPSGLPEPQLTATGEYIANNNYLQRDLSGKIIEKTKAMFWRVAPSKNFSNSKRILKCLKIKVNLLF
jgi:hypothetical protein